MAMSNPELSDPIQSTYDISTTPAAASSINSEIRQQQQRGQVQEQKAEQNKVKEDKDEPGKGGAACHRSTRSTAAADPHESTPFSGEFLKVVADDEGNDDGFRTPTRPESRIPEIRTCPPPPRKNSQRPSSPASSSRKRRKLWSTGAPTADGVLLDLSMEVESMFPLIIRANCGQKIKRSARSC